MFYTCYELSRMGWIVMPTSRNAVPLGSGLDKILGDYWVIVDKVASEPRAFILLPQDVKKLAKFNEKNGKRSYWLNAPEYDQEKFANAWYKIGYGTKNA